MEPNNHNKDKAEWPYRSLLWYGFFGMDSPGGKTLVKRTSAGLIVFCLAVFYIAIPGPDWLKPIAALMIPVSVAFIMWSGWRYLNGLDDLSRLIQLKAYAFSYGIAAVLAGTLFALEGYAGMRFSPLWIIIIAEPLRGVSLYVIAKQYR